MSSFRFAVIADTHYCTLRGRPSTAAYEDLERLPDYFRYASMVNTLQDYARQIQQAKPELLISTGDLIEGGADSPRDHEEACQLFAQCAPQFALARGSHDAPPTDTPYRMVKIHGCVFILLDYTCWNETQKEWLIQQLEQAKDAPHLFVFAHPPIHLFGRHFFHSPDFCNQVGNILKDYPVDIYFCGHTHNQCVSFHSGMLQIAGSTIGYPHQTVVPLEEIHAIPSTPANQFIWGIAEDSAPAFWLVDVEDRQLTLQWRSCQGKASLKIPNRFQPPEIISTPPFDRKCTPLTENDRLQVRTGWLNIFTANRGDHGIHVSLNNVPLDDAPESLCYAARRFVTLTPQAVRTIRQHNEVTIDFPKSQPFALGSLSLELLLLDGRIIRSEVAPELFVSGNHPDFSYARERAIAVTPGEQRAIAVDFK